MFHLLMNKRNSWLVLWETFSYVETFFIKFNKEIQASLVLKARQVINIRLMSDDVIHAKAA